MSALISLLLVIAASAAPDYHPRFDPGTLKDDVAGTPNEVLVLGTPHLSGLPESFAPSHLEPLLARLMEWRPAIIAIEAVSGRQCDLLRRHPAHYPGAFSTYCWDNAPAQAATGLDVAAASAEADRLLAHWPQAPTASQRRRLAAVFLAAGESASALVQWLRLPETERHEGDGLDAALVERLETLRTRRNENYLIGAALAARLGLEQVVAMDDHTADAAMADLAEDAGMGAALRRIWSNPAAAQRRAEDEERNARLGGAGAVMDLYRAANDPAAARVAYDADFGAALRDATPQHYGRRYAGWWETRNLRMVANIRAALATEPGSRALIIVGASHKGYFEAYLDMMHDVRLVDAQSVLE